MYFPDLGTECQVGDGAFVRAIGWLSSEHPFTAGSVPDQFLTTLHQHIKEAGNP